MKMKLENKLNEEWNRYLREVKDIQGFYEIKRARKNKLFFHQFEPQQLEWMMDIQMSGITWKLSDADIRLKPCDGFHLGPTFSYVVVRFNDCFIAIDMNTFVMYMNNTDLNYLDYDTAKDYAFRILKVTQKKEKIK